jgi:hypothetical protein
LGRVRGGVWGKKKEKDFTQRAQSKQKARRREIRR